MKFAIIGIALVGDARILEVIGRGIHLAVARPINVLYNHVEELLTSVTEQMQALGNGQPQQRYQKQIAMMGMITIAIVRGIEKIAIVHPVHALQQHKQNVTMASTLHVMGVIGLTEE